MMDPLKEAAVWERVRASSGGGEILEKKTVLEEKSSQNCAVRCSGWKSWGAFPLFVAVVLLMKRR